MKREFLKLALCVVSLLPIGAWAQTTSLITFDNYAEGSGGTTSNDNGGYTDNADNLEIEVGDMSIYLDGGTKSKIVSKSLTFALATATTEDEREKFDFQYCPGGPIAKTSGERSITITLAKAGTLTIYPRSASNSATDRTVTIKQGETTLLDAATVADNDMVTINSKTYYKAYAVKVEAGTVNIITNNAINFSGFKFVASAVVDTRTDVTLAYEPASATITQGNVFSSPTLSATDGDDKDILSTLLSAGAIAFSSDNTDVATVDATTGAISLAGGVGTAVITATIKNSETYKDATATFTLTVESPEPAEPTVNTTTTWLFNDVDAETVYNTNGYILDGNLYTRATYGNRTYNFTVNKLATAEKVTFADGYMVEASNVLSISAGIRQPNAIPASENTVVTGDYGLAMLAFNASVPGTLYIAIKSDVGGEKNIRIYHSEKVSSDKLTGSTAASTAGALTYMSYTSSAAGTFFFGDTGGTSSVYAVRFVPTSEKKDEWIYIGETGYATYGNISGKDIESLPDGLTAYKASAASDGHSVTLTSLDGMRRGQGYVISGTPNTNYGLTYGGETLGTEYNGGDMVRVTDDMENFAATADGKNRYILGNDNGTAKFFTPSGSGTLKKGKAYLQTTKTLTPANGARGISIVFGDGDTTGVNEVLRMKNEEFTTAPIYNLAGQKVSESYKGIVIVNGKKVIRK